MPRADITAIDSVARRAGAVVEGLVEQRAVQELLGQVSSWSDRVGRIQEAALGALNLPTAVGVSRLERRIRGVSDRIGRLEDQLDRIAANVARSSSPSEPAAIGELTAEVAALRASISAEREGVAAQA
jgi:hypothetical protein